MSRLIERVKFGGHGQGSLAKYDDGPNWISIYCTRGREHRESTGTPDLKLARRFHKQRLDELAVDRQGLRKFIAPMAQRVTITELLDDYAADIRLREAKSLEKMLAHMKPVRAYFGPMRAMDVTADMVDRYIQARLAAKKSNATVNRGTAILATAFKLAQRRGKVTTVPMIRKLPETNVRRVFYDNGEFERAVTAAPDYLRDALRFFYGTGWRKQEVVGLKWNMVDLVAGTITLPTSKNTRGRALALAGDLAALMKRREADRLIEMPDGGVKIAEYVFHRRGEPLGDFKRAWATARIKAGLASVVKDASGKVVTKKDGTPHYVFEKTIHDFRRTAARNLSRAGVRRDVAKAITGHLTDMMYSRYNITDEGDLREGMEKLSTYIATLPTQTK
jgi:integrase